jgi:hypothetical protein
MRLGAAARQQRAEWPPCGRSPPVGPCLPTPVSLRCTCALLQGEWAEGKMHGQGCFTDGEGHRWEGQFYNGAGPGLTCRL